MNKEDLIYVLLLFFSIGFGSYYRQLPNAEAKKKIGALVGFLIVLSVSRLHTLHALVTTLGNALIVCYVSKRHCHLVSFAFSFLYLIFFRTTLYFGIPYPPSHTNLVQMVLTLKLVGLNFEVNSAFTSGKRKDYVKSEEELIQDEWNNFKLGVMDVFYYGFNYVGVLTGPYFKYRTYYDHLHRPFNKYDDFKTATLRKFFPLVPIFTVVFFGTDHQWPLSYSLTTDFEQRCFLYRYWYIWPTFLTFRMRIYIGLILSECVCTMAGLGVYPAFGKSKSGNGPTENFVKMKEICNDERALKSTQYDYETIHNINPYGTEFYPTIREGIRNWNITVQFWLAMCVYKRFPSKKFRTFATMLVSAVWHGVYAGYYICIGSVPFGIMFDDIWSQVLLKDEFFVPKVVGEWLMWFLKMQLFSYQTVAFRLQEVKKIMQYYNSVYHCMPVFYLILYFVGKKLLRIKKHRLNSTKVVNEEIANK